MSKRYDLDVGKRRVRRRWKEFIKSRVANRKKAQILCFPGEYGFEIEQCYRPLEFREENIWGIERDPAAAKLIKQRYPNINLIEMDLMDFVRQYEGPPFSIVSLDYCGHFGADKIIPLSILTARGMLAERCCIAINVMAGREQAKDQAGMRTLYARVLMDQARSVPDSDPVDVHDALGMLQNANEEELSEVRENALTQSILSQLGYLMPNLKVSYDFDLTHVSGTAVQLRPDTKLVSDDGAGRMVFENVVVSDNSDRMQLANQIKHEAIYDINKELKDRGIIEYAKLDAQIQQSLRNKTFPRTFFDYHMGRTLVMAFYDQYGAPDFPVGLERYSYISESGKRMLSDFIETRQLRSERDRMPTMIAPLHVKDSTEHRFCLYPKPEVDTPEGMAEYLKKLKKLVLHYAEHIAKLIKTEAEHWPDREDLGGGESININEDKLKARVVELVKKGRTTEEIAQKVPYLQPGQIRAIRAHVTMNSYDKKKAKG